MNGYSAGPSASAAAAPSGSETIAIPPGPTNQPRVFVRGLSRDEAVFHLSGVELAYANSLRRVIMADVPTVGELDKFITCGGTEGASRGPCESYVSLDRVRDARLSAQVGLAVYRLW